MGVVPFHNFNFCAGLGAASPTGGCALHSCLFHRIALIPSHLWWVRDVLVPTCIALGVVGDPTLLVQLQLLLVTAGFLKSSPTLVGCSQVAVTATCSGSHFLALGSFSCGRVEGATRFLGAWVWPA